MVETAIVVCGYGDRRCSQNYLRVGQPLGLALPRLSTGVDAPSRWFRHLDKVKTSYPSLSRCAMEACSRMPRSLIKVCMNYLSRFAR